MAASSGKRRIALGLTQEQLGERAGMQQPSVARFEAGGTMPTIPVLERLANALDLRLTIRLEPPQGGGPVGLGEGGAAARPSGAA
ncbi:hypothetical protein GCM10023205_58270 [Yinghuangia aomiensis]|uniref:HTH cro/C1-type domain-containing protein n=1 Tax=Yinghuangia aomiensis TaxID=676205 RepID=A0ABP9HXQ4_9ACTN